MVRLRFTWIFLLTYVLLFVSWAFSINGFLGIACTLYMVSIFSMVGTVIQQLGTRRRIAHLRLVK